MTSIALRTQDEVIRQLYECKLSAQEIAQGLKINPLLVEDAKESLKQYLQKHEAHQGRIRHADIHRFDKERKDFAIELYEAGMTLDQIHEVTHLSISKLKHIREKFHIRSQEGRVKGTNAKLAYRLAASFFATSFLAMHPAKSGPIELLDVLLAFEKTRLEIRAIPILNCAVPIQLSDVFEIAKWMLCADVVGALDGENLPLNLRLNSKYRCQMVVCPQCGRQHLFFCNVNRQQQCPYCELLKKTFNGASLNE